MRILRRVVNGERGMKRRRRRKTKGRIMEEREEKRRKGREFKGATNVCCYF